MFRFSYFSIANFSALAKRQRPQKNILSITDNAVSRIKEMLKTQSNPNIIGVKVGVRRRGCNGLSYTMNYCESQEKFDEIIEDKGEVIFSGIFSGVKVVVDSKAIMVLIGTEMDYVEDDIKAEFVFKNPNEKGQCGCGESFHI